MNDITIMELESQEVKDFFIHTFENNLLVPILGSGFSTGLRTRKGKVPTGTELKAEMINALTKMNLGTKDEFLSKTFSKVSEDYFDECTEENIIEYFSSSFNNVFLNKDKKWEFLNVIDWSYIYTLNIDTAIEDSHSKWEVYYPNNDFYEDNDNEKTSLYKIHGDIRHYLKTRDIETLIFSETQYLKSISKNRKFHELLRTDFLNKNIIFIGCSLDDEIDLKFSVFDTDDIINNSTRRIFVTSEDIMNNRSKLRELKKYKINCVIKLKDYTEYSMFYEYLVNLYNQSLLTKVTALEHFKVSSIDIDDGDGKDNLKQLIGYNDNQFTNKKISLPSYYIERSISKSLVNSNKAINIVVGRRYSGKTYIAMNLISMYKDRNVYYVSSNYNLSSNILEEFIELKSSIVIYDTNTISELQFNVLTENLEVISKNNSKVFIMLDTSDEMTNILSRNSFKDLVFEYNEEGKILLNDRVKGKLDETEIIDINEKLDRLKIIQFDQRITILDNVLRIGSLSRYNMDISRKYNISNNDELVLLIWLAVHKKIYFEDIVKLGLSSKYSEIVNKFNLILQVEHTVVSESKKHSSIKIIVNARIALLRLLSDYVYSEGVASYLKTEIRNQRIKNLGDSIHYILVKFHKKPLPQNIIKFLMFDTLNEIFSKQYTMENIKNLTDNKFNHTQKGASRVIRQIYANENIHELQKSEPNYWLQRAKSYFILNTDKSNEDLREGLNYAIKALADSETKVKNKEYKYLRTYQYSLLECAMYYTRYAARKKFKDEEINNQAIIYYNLVLDEPNLRDAVNSIFMKDSRGTIDLKNLIESSLAQNLLISEELKYQLNRIVNEYNNLRSNENTRLIYTK